MGNKMKKSTLIEKKDLDDIIKIREFVKKYSNDYQLGKAIRELYISEDVCSHGNSINSGCNECDEDEHREIWVCELCGKNTYDVDWEYIGTGTNHLGCELELEMNIDKKTYDKMSNAVDVREKKWLQKNHR